jgi:hypothetical protein
MWSACSTIPHMGNTWKWGAILVLGAFGGIAEASSDRGANTSDYIRHAIIGAVPAAIGLRTTLEKAVGMADKGANT